MNHISHNSGSKLLVLSYNTNTMVIQCAMLQPAGTDKGIWEEYLGSRNCHQMWQQLLKNPRWNIAIYISRQSSSLVFRAVKLLLAPWEVKDMTEISCISYSATCVNNTVSEYLLADWEKIFLCSSKACWFLDILKHLIICLWYITGFCKDFKYLYVSSSS